MVLLSLFFLPSGNVMFNFIFVYRPQVGREIVRRIACQGFKKKKKTFYEDRENTENVQKFITFIHGGRRRRRTPKQLCT